MVSFASDYIAGAHPAVLDSLVKTNMEALSGYGTDPYCLSAIEKIKKACECPNADVYFVTGGTQANQVVISTVLDNYQGVIAAKTGHISLHEAGAIEYSRHKVIELEGKDGKVIPELLENYLKTFFADENHEHMVIPGMVYISFPTEYGTLYSKSELETLRGICDRYELSLYMDGARLGYGLASKENDLTLSDIARLTDVFYIGGTKVGALCGEAIVFTHNNAPRHFVTQIKQHGALVAKGRLMGIQFDTLFTNDLYMEIGRYAIEKAEMLKSLFAKKGISFFLESPTNQQFVILDNKKMEELSKKVVFSFWEPYDENSTVVRFATSWSTSDEDLKYLESIL